MKTGYDEETLASMDCIALITTFAESLTKPPSVATVSHGDLEFSYR